MGYPLVNCHIANWKMAIYSEFSHEKWWFSIVRLVYQRVTGWGFAQKGLAYAKPMKIGQKAEIKHLLKRQVLGMSSSQLTNSYFSSGLKPPTRMCDDYNYLLMIYTIISIVWWVTDYNEKNDINYSEFVAYIIKSWMIILLIFTDHIWLTSSISIFWIWGWGEGIHNHQSRIIFWAWNSGRMGGWWDGLINI